LGCRKAADTALFAPQSLSFNILFYRAILSPAAVSLPLY
jgi:hypothetical protein